GRTLIARGEMMAATVALRDALRLRPDLAEARASLGLALYAMGDLDGAVEELRGLLRVRPDLAEARLTLAAALVARQDWPAARAELETALAAQPELLQAGYTLGVVRYAQGDLAGAIDAYRRVLARAARRRRALQPGARAEAGAARGGGDARVPRRCRGGAAARPVLRPRGLCDRCARGARY